MMDYLLISGMIYLGFMYLGMPLLVLKQNSMPAKYTLSPFSTEEENTLDEEFKAYDQDILDNGFHHIVSSQVKHQKTTTFFNLYIQHTKKLSILLTSIDNPNVKKLQYLEVTQLFSDDTLLSVMNSSVASFYPESPRKVGFRYPKVKKVSQLVQIIEYILEEYLSNKTAISLPEGEELKLLERFFNEEQQELIDKGHVSPKIVQEERMLTIKGAYFMTWKLLWPVKQILAYRELAHAQSILKN